MWRGEAGGRGGPQSQLRGSLWPQTHPCGLLSLGLVSYRCEVWAGRCGRGAEGRKLASGRPALAIMLWACAAPWGPPRFLRFPALSVPLGVPPARAVEGGRHPILLGLSQRGPGLRGNLQLSQPWGHAHLIAALTLFLSTQLLLGCCKELKLDRKMDSGEGIVPQPPSQRCAFSCFSGLAAGGGTRRGGAGLTLLMVVFLSFQSRGPLAQGSLIPHRPPHIPQPSDRLACPALWSGRREEMGCP